MKKRNNAMNPTWILRCAVAASLAAGCSSASPSATDAGPSTDVVADAARADGSADAAADGSADAPAVIDASGPFTLAPGEVAEVPWNAGTAALRVATSVGTERYVLVLASTQLDAVGDPVAYTVSASAAVGSPRPTVVSGCSLDAARWRAMTLPAETAPTGTAPAMGTERSFDVPTGAGTSERITARVIAVGERSVVWADTTAAHPATLDPAFVTSFVGTFDQTIVPRERTEFGTESDIDHDGRIALLFTPLTNRTAVAFFQQCDLQRVAGCRASNGAEVLYLTPPNVIRPPYNTVNAMNEILAHELGHLIHFGRKVLRNHLPGWDDNAYMIEGFGALAQDVIGFQAGNLYVTQAGLDQIDSLSLADIVVDRGAYDATRDGTLRGGAYLFVRWLYDRGGGDVANADGSVTNRGGPAFVRTLIDDVDTVAGALPTVSGAAMPDVAMDFFTTLAVSNRDEDHGVAPVNGCFAYLPVAHDPVTMDPRGADVFATFHGMQMHGPATQPVGSADGMLRPGGVEFLSLDATAGQPEVAVTVTVDPGVAPRLRIGRIR